MTRILCRSALAALALSLAACASAPPPPPPAPMAPARHLDAKTSLENHM